MAWKVYFVCLAILVVGSFFGRIFLRFMRPDVVKQFDLVQSLVSVIALVGIYGYVFGVEIADRALWMAVAVVVFVFAVLELFQPKNKQIVAKLGAAKASLLFGASTLVTLPGYIALVIYAFGKHPWVA